jgi:hypothetical protein
MWKAQSHLLWQLTASQGFRSFWGAWRTIAGYEAVNMIRKGQARRVGKGEMVQQLCLITALCSASLNDM